MEATAENTVNKPNNKKFIIQRTLSVIGFILFALFSSAQANDVSQYGTAAWLTDTWLIGYGALSLICLYNALRPLPAKTFLALAAVTFALALLRGSQIDWEKPLFCFTAPKEFAERNPAGNETGGLIVMTLWLLTLWWANKRLLKNSK